MAFAPLTLRRAARLSAIPIATTRGKQSYKIELSFPGLGVLGAGKGQEERRWRRGRGLCLTQKGTGGSVCDQRSHLEKETLAPGLKDRQ